MGSCFIGSAYLFATEKKQDYYNGQCVYSDNIGYRIIGQNDNLYILEYTKGFEKSHLSYVAQVKIEVDKELVNKEYIQIVCP